jgi:hypothetical protein
MNMYLLSALVIGGVLLTYYQTRANRKIAAAIFASNAALAAKSNKADEENKTKLDEIHYLVNSNLTAARRSELEATRRDLASLRELANFKVSQGFPVSGEATEAIDLTAARVTELSAELEPKP